MSVTTKVGSGRPPIRRARSPPDAQVAAPGLEWSATAAIIGALPPPASEDRRPQPVGAARKRSVSRIYIGPLKSAAATSDRVTKDRMPTRTRVRIVLMVRRERSVAPNGTARMAASQARSDNPTE